jgi:hypothetical protein
MCSKLMDYRYFLTGAWRAYICQAAAKIRAAFSADSVAARRHRLISICRRVDAGLQCAALKFAEVWRIVVLFCASSLNGIFVRIASALRLPRLCVARAFAVCAGDD